MGFFSSLFTSKTPENNSKTTAQIIIEKYYANYPETPYISVERGLDWIERAEMFPKQCIIPKTTMKRYADGLLPGHIYMLYWLEKYTDKKIPAYFEYDYGIDFEKEKRFLALRGYLSCDKPTTKGMEAIKNHYEVIKARHPSPARRDSSSTEPPSITPSGRTIPDDLQTGVMQIKPEDKPIITADFKTINTLVNFALELSGLKVHLEIVPTEFAYGAGKTYYECRPITPSGRHAKYPLILHYKYKTFGELTPQHDYFGEIKYLQNGSIGSAKLIFWNRKNGYMIHLGIVDKKTHRKKSRGSYGLLLDTRI